MGDWKSSQYAMPAPQEVKWAVLRRYGGPADTWVETGTYLGDTTDFLASTAKHVYSIEPAPELVTRARHRFQDNARVTIVAGLSEDTLGPILDELAGPVSFWLDGHYSAGITHRGPEDTPIRAELTVIEEHLPRLGPVTVLVDDVRLFDPRIPEFSSYPPRAWLVSWAERNHLVWNIEHDIFAAWTPVDGAVLPEGRGNAVPLDLS
jgi:hypothetical protein